MDIVQLVSQCEQTESIKIICQALNNLNHSFTNFGDRVGPIQLKVPLMN